MKALELTVYPPLKRPRYGYGIDPYREQWKRERKIVLSKRLTDAELAAEHWSSCALWFNAVRRDDDYDGARDTREHQRQALIFERFATLPHYDEDQQ